MSERKEIFHLWNKVKILLILIICILGKVNVFAQDEMQSFDKNGSLKLYVQYCQNNINSIQSLFYADKMFHKAGVEENKRMQAVALYYKMMYYMYQSSTAQIIITTNKLKIFAKTTKQPYYYYIGWSNGIIRHYINLGKLNLAIDEIKKMLKEARAEKSAIGYAACYDCFATYYDARGFDQLAYDNKIKEIDLLENTDYTFNISYKYLDVCNFYISTKQYGDAGRTLVEANEEAKTPSQKFMVNCTSLHFYTEMKNFNKAQVILENTEKMLLQNPTLKLRSNALYENEFKYYQATDKQDKALDAIEKLHNINSELHEYDKQCKLNIYKAQIYETQGKKEEAIKYYKRYIAEYDSLMLDRAKLSIGEYVTILDMEQLNSDKDKLSADSRDEKLEYRRTIIFVMGAFLLLFILLLYNEKRLNNRLKMSEFEALERNIQLTNSQKELKLAKAKVERASEMKTVFIQNMTHQIRTPLNQIVGFSQILTSSFDKNDEYAEYANIIETSSNELLQLVNDVLDISELDQKDLIPSNTLCELNATIQSCIDIVKIKCKKDIDFIFHPTIDILMIKSDPRRLMQVMGQLLRNAVNFTEKGNITIQYDTDRNRNIIQIAISDTGIGISTDNQDKIFERFYKVNEFTQGVGLGLSISRIIAEKMGGSLALDKSYTGGCKFILTLPLIDSKSD